jgi:hypothetical protein
MYWPDGPNPELEEPLILSEGPSSPDGRIRQVSPTQPTDQRSVEEMTKPKWLSFRVPSNLVTSTSFLIEGDQRPEEIGGDPH